MRFWCFDFRSTAFGPGGSQWASGGVRSSQKFVEGCFRYHYKNLPILALYQAGAALRRHRCKAARACALVFPLGHRVTGATFFCPLTAAARHYVEPINCSEDIALLLFIPKRCSIIKDCIIIICQTPTVQIKVVKTEVFLRDRPPGPTRSKTFFLQN